MEQIINESCTEKQIKAISRRSILKILASSGAVVASYLIAPAAWARPNISAIQLLLLGEEAAPVPTDDIEISTTQDNDAVCHDYCPTDSRRLLPLGALATGNSLPGAREMRGGGMSCVYCSANFTTTFRSVHQLNLTSSSQTSYPFKDKTGPWNFTWFRAQDNLTYQSVGNYWTPLGSLYTANLTQSYQGGAHQGTIRQYNSVMENATVYHTQLKHGVYDQSIKNYTYSYSKNATTTIRYQ